MKVYVATSFSNITEARAVMAALEKDGHEITHDWTKEAIDPSWSAERQATYLQTCGAKDFEGVENADVLVLVNHALARDAMTEFGIAMGLRKPVCVLYPERRTSVFFHRAIKCPTLADLTFWLHYSDPEKTDPGSGFLRAAP